jgi:hypothetical protein
MALATAVLTVTMLGNALTVSATGPAETASVISVHSDTTVVPLPADSYVDVATLLVPAGTWLLLANADFINTDPDDPHTIKCRLVANGQADVTETGLTTESTGADHRTLTSELPRYVASINGLQARWRCRAWEGQDGSVVASSIRLMAVKIGTLKTFDLATNSVTSEGSGTPRVWSGRLDGAVNAPLAGAAAVVASIHLNQGSWWVLAKAVARNHDGSAHVLSCNLLPLDDQASVALAPTSRALAVQSLALQGAFYASKKSGAPVRLKCESSATTAGEVTIEAIRITALRAGSLGKLAPSGSTPSPAVVQIRRVPEPSSHFEGALGAGHWVGVVTGLFTNAADVLWTRPCASIVGSDPVHHFDVTTAAASTPGSFESASAFMAGTIETSQDAYKEAAFSCGEVAPPPGSDVRASFIRAVLLKTDSLTDTAF